MNTKMSIATILVVAIVTAITRGLPYLIFGKREVPKSITYLSAVFPASIMVILVFYCLRNIKFTSSPYGLPEIISVIIVAITQVWKKNSILSIFLGTASYMVLIQLLF